MDSLLNEINKIKDKAVIVEGKRDIIALKKLGFTNIFSIKKPLYKICEDIAKIHNEVIILTDLDKEGKKLYSKLKFGLERCGVKINNRFREYLFKETELAHIEGLDSYVDRLCRNAIA